VLDPGGVPEIVEACDKGVGDSELLVQLAQQRYAGEGGQAIWTAFDSQGSVEIGAEQSIVGVTDRMSGEVDVDWL
jgi:hypothetical protein